MIVIEYSKEGKNQTVLGKHLVNRLVNSPLFSTDLTQELVFSVDGTIDPPSRITKKQKPFYLSLEPINFLNLPICSSVKIWNRPLDLLRVRPS